MTWLSWFPDTAWKGTVLLAVAWLVVRLLQKQSPALRHLVWTVAIGGLLVMPVLSATTPVQFSLPSRAVVAPPSASTLAAESGTAHRELSDVQQRTAQRESDIGESSRPDAHVAKASVLPAWTTAQWLIAVWLLGAGALGIRFLASVVATRRLRPGASDSDEYLHAALQRATERAGIRVTPQLVVTDSVAMPCAFGWVRPTIVLPPDAREWSRDRLDMVLLHEATHIRRGDYAIHLVAEVARILHWYNPLVWVASRSLRAEAERATDERVISAGATASDYAGHLLDIVRGAGSRPIPAPLLPLAARSEFEGRVIAILEYAGSHRLRARTAVAALVVGAGLTATVASIGAASPRNEEPTPSVQAVLPELQQRDPAPQQRREQSLDELVSSVRALVQAINDSVPSVRLAVVNALKAERDTAVVRALMQVLREDTSAEVRRAAAHSLGAIGDVLALPALTQALDSDSDLEVRVDAAEALGNFEAPAAADALARALGRATDHTLKIAVIEALDNHEGNRATPALIAALRDTNAGVRTAAANALDGVEDPSVIPALIAAARDSDVEVRRAVIDALNDFDDPRLVDVFANALIDGDPEIRSAAASGLGNMDDLRTAPRQLIAAMEDTNAEVRHEVAHALGHIGGAASLAALIARVNDPVVEVRQAVVEALSEFEDASVTPVLQKALRDSDPEVRKTAASALGDRRRK